MGRSRADAPPNSTKQSTAAAAALRRVFARQVRRGVRAYGCETQQAFLLCSCSAVRFRQGAPGARRSSPCRTARPRGRPAPCEHYRVSRLGARRRRCGTSVTRCAAAGSPLTMAGQGLSCRFAAQRLRLRAPSWRRANSAEPPSDLRTRVVAKRAKGQSVARCSLQLCGSLPVVVI